MRGVFGQTPRVSRDTQLRPLNLNLAPLNL